MEIGTSLAAIAAQLEDQEFLRVTATTLKILQNIQNEPSESKYRKLRRTSAFCSKPGVADLMETMGFEKMGNHYVLDEAFVPSLSAKKRDIRASRKKTHSILGWDVPFSMLKFRTALGACKYGEVFGGTLDGSEVVMKTLKPDGGEMWRESFDRELELLHKLDHENIVKLEAVTLTSDPTSIILEYIPTSLLGVLNHSELGDEETASIALEVAAAMVYLHSQCVLHCDLGARNIRLTSTRKAKLCDFGLACREDSDSCTLTSERVGTLPLRWTAPEVLQQLQVTRQGDVWSYGVFLYELVTNGSVPYASFNNQQVRSKVTEGYRLPQPHNCPDELYSLMFQCWLPRATERPKFDDVIHNHLDPLKVKANEGRLTRQNSTSTSEDDGKSSTLKSPRGSTSGGSGHKLKVKEPLYPQVLGKGGGLLRMYTALISPFHHRMTIVCGKKTTVAEVVQIALAKCGKLELDHRCHSIAVVSPHSSDCPAWYLGSEDRVMAVKAEAAANVMFVLCLYSPGPAILETVNSIRQNPAYGTAFDLRTRGYLVTMETGEGTGRRGKQGSGVHRSWCVLDDSSLLCYGDEEDEGVKQFESFVDVKNSSVSPLTGKKSSTMVRVGTADGGEFIFSTSDKADMLRWIEAITTARHLEPSTMLLHSGAGVVVQTGFLDCQEFALESTDSDKLRPPPPLNRRLGTSADISGAYSAIDYGRHWTVLKSSGLIQCLVQGRPEILFSLPDATKVKVHNPRKTAEGAHYYISLYGKASRVVLQAECPSDHFDWVVAIERVLEERGLGKLWCGDRGRQSGYVTLKRLMKLQEGGKLGDRGSAMQLYAMPRLLNMLDDVYEVPEGNSTPRHDYENQNSSPLSPPAYVNFVPPPPIPPRTTGPPPLPPKGVLRSLSEGAPGGLISSPPDTGSDYIVMSPPSSLPMTPSSAPPSHLTPSPSCSPTTPNRAHPPLRPGSQASQPITIPSGHAAGLILRSDSEASSNSAHDYSLPSSAAHSLPRHPSTSSTHSLTSSLLHRQASLVTAAHEESSGYSSPRQSPGVGVARKVAPPHLVSQVAHSAQSEGYHSGPSSADDMVQPLPAGWRKGYCDSKMFFVNTDTGCTAWSLEEVFATSGQEKVARPGGRWQLVTLEDGQVYYYNEVTRQTTWNVQDTF